MFEPFTKQDREAVLLNARSPVRGYDIIMPLTLERYEATVLKLEAELAVLRSYPSRRHVRGKDAIDARPQSGAHGRR